MPLQIEVPSPQELQPLVSGIGAYRIPRSKKSIHHSQQRLPSFLCGGNNASSYGWATCHRGDTCVIGKCRVCFGTGGRTSVMKPSKPSNYLCSSKQDTSHDSMVSSFVSRPLARRSHLWWVVPAARGAYDASVPTAEYLVPVVVPLSPNSS